MRSKCAFLSLLALVSLAPAGGAQSKYERPPKEILEVLSAPATPLPIPSPTGKAFLLVQPEVFPPISDLAEPMLRLAGVRVNPRNNALHGDNYYFLGYTLVRLSGGPAVPVALPAGSRLGEPLWNAAGTRFAFSNTTATAVELWVGEAATARARRVDGLRLNSVLGYGIAWMPDQTTLLVKAVPAGRPAPPPPPAMPAGPRIEDSGKVTAPSSTYEARDLLTTPYDADLFEHYGTAQLALVDAPSGRVTRIGSPGVLAKVSAAPGGRFLLVERIERPYSFQRTFIRFPAEVAIWDTAGRKVSTLARLPLAEQVPNQGVRVGPREHEWSATAPATLVWAEALDQGDTYKKVPHHDRLMLQAVDVPGAPAEEWLRTEQRFAGIDWIEDSGLAMVTDVDLDRHWTRTLLLDAGDRKAPARTLWSRSFDDGYGNPGLPVHHVQANGARAVRRHEGAIFLAGRGASPEGNRPFLDRLDLASLRTERLFRSGHEELESFLEWADLTTMTFLTRRESPTEPPNVYARTLGAALPEGVAGAPAGEAGWRSTAVPLTRFQDPAPQLRRISKQLVTYRRPDGVSLSFTLYLPPGYQPGTRLPTILQAYPLDYTEASAAGQVAGSPRQFTTLYYASPVYLALAGYAVLDRTAMPVVGPTGSAYDSFVEQIVANAKAAIAKAVELGVTDPERVGVTGHSHGALMTANLLVWSDLFKAGVAESGAYNHTLRPFGFQNERRTLYNAPETYLKLSPLLHADRIRRPLLLIHGERDANPGTVPLQSEKLFEAIRGVGGTARLVVLPLESHGYAARESVEHALYEMAAWFDRYVKNAGR